LAPYLGVSLEEVRTNFERYGLLDKRVRFLPGWFKDTLPSAPLERIAVLRLDGDMYESTIEALVSLYGKVAEGGFIIVDDYGALPNCRAAVEDFRASRGIVGAIAQIDWTGVYWRKVEVALTTQESIDSFDEEAYLLANADVAAAVNNGQLLSGKQHFLQWGRNENRRMRVRPHRISADVHALGNPQR
jgi:hypothetical protein